MRINIKDIEQRSYGEIPRILVKRDQENEKIFSVNNINPKLSIISCSMNLGKFLEDTILSIARQSYTDYEHIVIDGLSTDNTIEILKKYSHIKWVSEKDSGYTEALHKGLAMSKGKYIMQCAVSDGYLDKDWFKKCVDLLDDNPEISLIWGFPQYLSEDGKLGSISYPKFHNKLVPQKFSWVFYWLHTGFWFPEGNFCVRKEVFEKCYPENDNERQIEPYLEFNYNFNKLGYLPYHIPTVANFGRTHENQLGQRDKVKGLQEVQMDRYLSKVKTYQKSLLVGRAQHIFRDGFHQPISVLHLYNTVSEHFIYFIKIIFLKLFGFISIVKYLAKVVTR